MQQADTKNLIIQGGREDFKYLHDLNALAYSKVYQDILREEFTIPELPYAGICYGMYISQAALALYLSSERTHTVYLSDFTQYFFDLFYSTHLQNKSSLLHKGVFPCYNLYRTKDKKVICFAPVEEKFWLGFNSISDLSLNLDDRFDKTGQVKLKIQNYFSSLTSEELKTNLHNKHLCINIIETKDNS